MSFARPLPLALITAAALLACTAKPAGPGAGAGAKREATPEGAAKSAEGDAEAERAAKPGAEAGEPEAKTEAEAETEAETEGDAGEAAAPVRFWVAHEGLRAYDLDGEQVASLGELGDRARRLADGRVVVYAERPHAAELAVLDARGKILRRVSLPGGFDPETCAPLVAAEPEPGAGEGEAELYGGDYWSPQASGAFRLDPGGYACLQLQDRNDNMASYGLKLAVDLATAELHSRVELDLEGGCEGKGELPAGACARSERGEPWIEGQLALEPRRSWPHGFDEGKHAITRAGEVRTVLCAAGADPEGYGGCSELESSSPSGRWLLLSGRWSEGDYVHRDLVLFDRSTGKLWQVVEEGGRDKASFVETQPAAIFAADGPMVLGVVGESDLGWLPGDRLWVDGRLLIPEQRKLVDIGGTRARTL